eukprot:10795624-Alexandrium_andersonii.AAC.1
MGGRGPSSPNRPNGPLRSLESAEIREPLLADLGAGGAARSAAPRLWRAGLRIAADSEPWRGPFGPLGELGPRPSVE